MAKIKTIKINGLRGVREPITLDLNKKSILVYGDNGMFKKVFYEKIDRNAL